jgi:hypothetical protein
MNLDSPIPGESSSPNTRAVIRYPSIPEELPPESEPYDPRYFADRRQELKIIARRVEEGRDGHPITQPVVHFWGVRGVGKSWLLRRLQDQYRFVAGRGEEKGTFCVLVDFSTFRFSCWEPRTAADLLEAFAQEIEEQLGEEKIQVVQGEIQAFREELERVRQERGRDADGLAERFVALINRLVRDFVPLLLLDATETLDEDDFAWLESHLIAPIARSDQAIFVVAGRKEIPRWREFSVRQRLLLRELDTFPPEGTQEQLEKRGYPRLGDLIHSFSFGHPYANQVLGGKLAGRIVDERFEAEHREEVVALLGQIEGELMRGVWREGHQDILRTLATLRRFNIGSTRYMLGRLLNPEYGEWSDARYLRLFEDLEDINLVWWDTGWRGYVMSTPLRRIIELRIRQEAPDIFVRRHREALKLYKKWIAKSPLDRGPLLLEALYHLVNSLAGEPLETVRQEVEELLKQFLTPESFTTDGAYEFYRLLSKDRELLDHRWVVPEDVYKYVLERARGFLDRLAGSGPVGDEVMDAAFQPAPYRPEEFVGREDELERVRIRIEQICGGGRADRPIVHFHSVPGIGKTWLLNHLAHQYRKFSCPQETGREVLPVLVDCARMARPSDVRGDLLQVLREGWGLQLEKGQGLPALTRAICSLAERFIPLLLLDAADFLDADDFGWLEEELLEPLACTGAAVIVVAGRANAPRWRRFETRRRVEYWPLSPFRPDETAELIRKAGLTTPHQEVHWYSGGHPHVARLLAQQTPWPPEEGRVGALLESVEKELLRHVPQSLWPMVRALAVLRRFNIGSMRDFLSVAIDPVYGEKSDGFFLEFLGEMLGEPDWLTRDRRGYYAFAPAVRSVLLWRLRLADPDLYEASHRAALHLYEERADTYPQYCARFLVEAIYHRTILEEIAGKSQEELGDELLDLLDGYLTVQNFSVDGARELCRTLEDDRELRERTPLILKELLSRIERFISDIGEKRHERFAFIGRRAVA